MKAQKLPKRGAMANLAMVEWCEPIQVRVAKAFECGGEVFIVHRHWNGWPTWDVTHYTTGYAVPMYHIAGNTIKEVMTEAIKMITKHPEVLAKHLKKAKIINP